MMFSQISAGIRQEFFRNHLLARFGRETETDKLTTQQISTLTHYSHHTIQLLFNILKNIFKNISIIPKSFNVIFHILIKYCFLTYYHSIISTTPPPSLASKPHETINNNLFSYQLHFIFQYYNYMVIPAKRATGHLPLCRQINISLCL